MANSTDRRSGRRNGRQRPDAGHAENCRAGFELAEQVELLRQSRTTHVVISPSIAAAWADAAPQSLPDLVAVITTGEVLRPETRAKIERGLKAQSRQSLFGKRTRSHRVRWARRTSADQRGDLFFEGPAAAVDPKPDPRRPHAALCFRHAADPLRARRFRPLLQRQREARPGLRRLEEVIGRQRNLLRQPDGSLFLPSRFVVRRLQAILDYREWQLVQSQSHRHRDEDRRPAHSERRAVAGNARIRERQFAEPQHRRRRRRSHRQQS